jgi:hypothetical protein
MTDLGRDHDSSDVLVSAMERATSFLQVGREPLTKREHEKVKQTVRDLAAKGCTDLHHLTDRAVLRHLSMRRNPGDQ